MDALPGRERPRSPLSPHMTVAAQAFQKYVVSAGPPADDDQSMGAHILRIRDAEGRPLPDARILPHLGMLFFAGRSPTWPHDWQTCAVLTSAASCVTLSSDARTRHRCSQRTCRMDCMYIAAVDDRMWQTYTSRWCCTQVTIPLVTQWRGHCASPALPTLSSSTESTLFNPLNTQSMQHFAMMSGR